MKTGIFIVDDHASFRATLREYLQESSEFEVVGEYRDGVEFLEAEISDSSVIVLLDISMPRLDGIAVLRQLIQKQPQMRVVIVSGRAEAVYRRSALLNGAAGFVPKDLVHAQLIPCIRKVLAGEAWFPEQA